MALFGFGKKEKDACACAAQDAKPCGCGGAAQETSCACGASEKVTPCGCGTNGTDGARCSVKVLGSGCKNCHTLYSNAQQAVQAMGLDAQLDYVTDMAQIAAYGVMRMPALVIDERVVSMGVVCRQEDVVRLLREAGYGA